MNMREVVSSDKSRANTQASEALVLLRLCHVVHRSCAIKREVMCLACLA